MFQLHRETALRLAVLAFGIAALIFGGLTAASADNYTYDTLGRLTGVAYTDGSSVTYAYDDAGNRVTVTQTAAP